MTRRNFTLCLALVFLSSSLLFAQSPGGLGRAPFGSYSSANVDTINLYNGNLLLDIPLFSIPGREGLSTDLRLTYNAQGWTDVSTQYATIGAYYGGWSFSNPAGNGSSVIPYLLSCDYSGWPVSPPSGTWGLYVAWTDGTGATHVYNAPELTGDCDDFPWIVWNTGAWLGSTGYPSDRTQALVYGGGSLAIRLPDGRVIRGSLETRNGNYAETDSSTSLLTHALGRTVAFSSDWTTISEAECGTMSTSASYSQYTVTDSGGTGRHYKLIWATYTVHNPIEDSSDTISVIRQIVLPNNRSYLFDYCHDQGFLTKVTLPTGGYLEFDYYGGISDHDVTHNYILNRRVSPDASAENQWTYTRTPSGSNRVVTVTSPVDGDDFVTEHTFDTYGYEIQTVWKNDANSDPLKTVDVTRGDAGQPSAIVTTMDGMHHEQTLSWSNSLLSWTTQSDWYTGSTPTPLTKTIYSYSSTHPYPQTQIELQAWNGSSYVGAGKTQFYYDEYTLDTVSGTVPNHRTPFVSPRFNLTTTRRYIDSSNYVEEHMHYDVLGNVVELVDARGKSTLFDFTDNFNGVSNQYTYAYPTLTTNAEGHEAATTYNFDTGLPVSVRDARDFETVMTYDLFNRPLTITNPNDRVTTYTYDDDPDGGLMVREEVTVSSGVIRKTETFTDLLSRPIQIKLYDPSGHVYQDTEYDDIGQVQRASAPYRTGSQVWTTTAYDVVGRPTTVTNPDSSTVTISYSGNTVTTTDEDGIQRRETYNALGQVVKVEEPNPTLSSPIETIYSYYVFGPLASVTQNDSTYGSQSRSFSSDWLGRITSETHPETGQTDYTYRADGLVETRTDARGVVTTYTHDDIGRPLSVTYANDGNLTPDIDYTYDQYGFAGFLTTAAVDGVTTSTYEYDDAGGLAEESVTLSGISGTFTTAYTYDLDGRLLTVTYPSGRVVSQTFSASGGIASDRLLTLTDSPTSATLVQAVEDNATGLVTSRIVGGKITESRTFNARNQLTRIAAAANGATLLDIGYGYGEDNTGRIRSRVDAVQQEHSAAYTFDPMGRLTEVSGGDGSWSIGWTLDRWGNRRTQTPSSLISSRIGSPSVAYSGNRNIDWTYDNTGNVTNDDSYNYTYDGENRLVQIDSSSIQYAYDHAGRRVIRTVPVSGGGSETTVSFYGLTGLTSEFTTTNTGASGAASTNRLQYGVGEQTGTAVMLMSSDGTPRENNRVFPFGEPWLSFAKSSNSEKFTTYQHDGANGEADLDYAMARYYASRSGRFMTADPGHVGANVKDPQSWNAYAYSANDPINRTDSTGTTYEVCVNGFSCFDVETQLDYFSVVREFWSFGYDLPFSVGSFMELSCINGQDCISVRYLDRPDLFIRDMDRMVDASNTAIVAFPIVTGLAGLGSYFAGLTAAGSELTTLGSVASEKIGTFSTKALARLAIQKLRLNPVQAASVMSTIARATATSRIEIFKSGQDIVVRTTRAGIDGYQAISAVIQKDGVKNVVQKAFNAVGELVHYHIWK